MTPLLLLLVVVQAALLLWASVHLSNIYLRLARLQPIVWGALILAGALALSRFGMDFDPSRVLCSTGDCLVLAITVACVRVIAVTREGDRLTEENALAARHAVAAAELARKNREAERIRVATAALEARQGRDSDKPSARPAPTSGLTGGVAFGRPPGPTPK